MSGTGKFNNPYNIDYEGDPLVKSIVMLNKKCKNFIDYLIRIKEQTAFILGEFRLPIETIEFLSFYWSNFIRA